MTTLNRLLILGLWSSALAGVTVWTASQLQDVAGLWPYPPMVARPQNSPNNLGGLNSPLGPWLQACMLGGVLSGVANLTADAYGYQGTPTQNATIAANVMYNVVTCGATGGGSSGGGGGGGGSSGSTGSNAKAYVDGKITNASPIGSELAKESDKLYLSINKQLRQGTTIAVAKVNGQFHVALNSRAPPEAVSRIASIAKARGYEFYYEAAITRYAGHAEQVLYNKLNKSITTIGISHSTGPCPICQGYFNGTGVELAYTGVWK